MPDVYAWKYGPLNVYVMNACMPLIYIYGKNMCIYPQKIMENVFFVFFLFKPLALSYQLLDISCCVVVVSLS